MTVTGDPFLGWRGWIPPWDRPEQGRGTGPGTTGAPVGCSLVLYAAQSLSKRLDA